MGRHRETMEQQTVISEHYFDPPVNQIPCPYSRCCSTVDIREIQRKCDKPAIEMVGIWA